MASEHGNNSVGGEKDESRLTREFPSQMFAVRPNTQLRAQFQPILTSPIRSRFLQGNVGWDLPDRLFDEPLP